MSRQSAKRRKTSATAFAGVSPIDNLPPELLETTFGFLDVRTLCTARLVCTQFHGAASRFLHSVELSVWNLRSRPKTTLNSFPNLTRVSVFDVRKEDLLMLAQSPVADAVTHLRAVEHLRLTPQCGRIAARSHLLPLPNLVSLTVGYAHGRAFPCAFPFPQTLRELILERRATPQIANLVASLTNLTSLRIDVHQFHEPFEAVTALTALQRLDISCSWSDVPFVAELSLLTHLSLTEMWKWAVSFSLGMPSLTRLHRLVHLGVGGIVTLQASWEVQLLASIGTFTSLKSLDLTLCERPERSAFEKVCMAPFFQLTALRLKSYGLDASFLPRFNLERVQELSLARGVDLDQDGVEALRRATRLTQLHIGTASLPTGMGPEDLGTALSYMSRLRSLSLATTATFQSIFCCKSIGLLTELTELKLCGRGVTTKAVVDECLGLKKLQLCSMVVPYTTQPPDCITPEIFLAIARLPELRKFEITGNFKAVGGNLKADVRAWLNAERHDKGWPPVESNVFN